MADKPHYKMPMHLRVGVAPDARLDPEPTVTFLAKRDAANEQGDPHGDWGVIVSFRPKHPERGLHLFPQSVLWLPNMLRARAVECGHGDGVVISHTTEGVFSRWGAFGPSDAQFLADQLEVATP